MNKHIELGALSDVARLSSDNGWTLVFVRVLRHPPARVWQALTDPEQMRAWSPFTANRNLGSVGPAIVSMIDGNLSEDSDSVVTAAEAPRLLEYSWGMGVLRWELQAEGSGTRLTLRHTIDDPDFLSKVAAGWHICLVVAEHLMDGTPVGPIVGEGGSKSWLGRAKRPIRRAPGNLEHGLAGRRHQAAGLNGRGIHMRSLRIGVGLPINWAARQAGFSGGRSDRGRAPRLSQRSSFSRLKTGRGVSIAGEAPSAVITVQVYRSAISRVFEISCRCLCRSPTSSIVLWRIAAVPLTQGERR